MKCKIYHIKTDGMGIDEGYIGVSIDVNQRIYNHFRLMKKGSHYNPILNRAFLKYDLSVSIVASGTVDEMYNLEEKLRPEKYIGWNIAIGGCNPPSNKGIKMSQNQKDKISKANKGKTNSEEHKKKAVATRRKNKSYKGMHSKSVQMLDSDTLEIIMEFESVRLAAEFFGKKVQGNISSVCRGERNIAMGYKWIYNG
tara:strand:+ start:50 stop:640 length:591 start_codon:yes stop_codon:yes gene_type:complete